MEIDFPVSSFISSSLPVNFICERFKCKFSKCRERGCKRCGSACCFQCTRLDFCLGIRTNRHFYKK